MGELNFEGMALLGKRKLFENKILEDRGGEVLCDGKMPGRFCVSLVAAVVGISFCVATGMSCSALLNWGLVKGMFCNILRNLTRNI